MATVALRAPLRELAGGSSELAVAGGTVGEVLAALEAGYPRLAGWIRDERGAIREHVSVFVNGERAGRSDRVGEGDRIDILPSISGGAASVATLPSPSLWVDERVDERADERVELLVGTRKGLVVLRGRRGGPMEVAARAFPGRVVEFAMRDSRSGTYLASVTHGQYGPRVFLAEDPAGAWEPTDGPAFPVDAGAAVERVWVIHAGVEEGVLWAGTAPAALFRSEDAGHTWSLNRGLWDQPSRSRWQPGAGGLCLHSICTWPGDPMRMAVGISAAGVWLTDDGGETWRRGVRGIVARYLPEEARANAVDLCVHNMHRSPIEPATLYMQFHGGVYRSDDAGESWVDIGAGLPSDFGFPAVVDPHDANRMFVIPMNADGDRVTCGGRLRVFETRDRGRTWSARSDGLPEDDAFFTVLRQAFCHDRRAPLGLYFGAESGEVFGSADGGVSWISMADRLPPILSVRCSS